MPSQLMNYFGTLYIIVRNWIVTLHSATLYNNYWWLNAIDQRKHSGNTYFQKRRCMYLVTGVKESSSQTCENV